MTAKLRTGIDLPERSLALKRGPSLKDKKRSSDMRLLDLSLSLQSTDMSEQLDELILDNIPHERPKFQPQAHQRLVLQTAGWPLTAFVSRVELLEVMLDALNGTKNLADDDIMHKDISVNNIICTGSERPNRGVLIDLEMAVLFKSHKSVLMDPRTGTLAFKSY